MKKRTIHKPILSQGKTLIDTHCHLDMRSDGTPLETLIYNAAEEGVHDIITVGIDVESSEKAIEIARRYPGVWATVGIHPHNAEKATSDSLKRIQSLATDPENKVVGYGEIGLDLAKQYAPPAKQVQSFEQQLTLAKQLDLPVIIHDRDAHQETLRILQDNAPYPAQGVMHCFSGDLGLAEKIMELGFFISIPGIVTFNKSDEMQMVARKIPLERMILETDGPFLAPVPYRGKMNRPEYLIYTAQKIADLRGTSLDMIAEQTTNNAKNLFPLTHS